MDSSTNTNLLYEIINNCTQSEFAQASLTTLKTAHSALGFKVSTKKKEELINDIYRYLSNILVRQGSTAQMRDGFPLFNSNNEFFQKNPSIKHLVELCNQKIHIANIQLAQVNYNKLNQIKKAMNLSEGQNVCICTQPITASDDADSLIKCINAKCGKFFHKTCMKVGPTADDYPLFECPDCILSKSDPLHEVIKALVAPYIVDNIAREFKIDQMLYREVKDNDDIGVEVRCIRLENKSHEQCWPHQGGLELNNTKLLEFRPLQLNSSLKRRKDEKFYSSDIKSGTNSVQLKFVKGSDPRNPDGEETYVAAVYLVKKITCESLLQTIKAENKRSVEDCKKMLAEEIANSGIDIDKVLCPLTCVYDMQPLKTPAKGAYCKHPNCFSLENFVNLWQKNNQRKWTCPICKVKSYDLIVDSYFEEILQDAKQKNLDKSVTTNVEILKDGSYRFVKEETHDEEDPELRAQIKIEKPADASSANLIVLDDSDDEGGVKDTQEPKDTINTEAVPAPSATLNGGENKEKSTAIEEEKPTATEEKKPEATVAEENKVATGAMEEEGEEEELPQRPQGEGLVIRDKSDQSKSAKEDLGTAMQEETAVSAGGVVTEPQAINIEDGESSRPIESLPTGKSAESQRKTGGADTMEEEVENKDGEKKKKERGRKKKDKEAAAKNGQGGQVDSLQAALEQYQQLQASEEYKLQQRKQAQLLQQQSMLMNMQGLQGMQGMQGMQGLQALQGLQAMNMANMMRQYGAAATMLQPQNMFSLMANTLMAGNLLASMQQQQMGMGSMDDMAAMLLGGGGQNYGGGGGGGADANYLASMMRNLNDLSNLQALKMNNQNFINTLSSGSGGGSGGQNATGLDALLLQMKNAEQQQGNAGSNAAAAASNRSTLSNPVKAAAASKQRIAVDEDEPQVQREATPPVEAKPVVYLRRDDGRPKKFIVHRDRPQARIQEDAEKSLEKLFELSDIKLDLPKFENYTQMNYAEMKKEKEFSLQKNKKFVAMVMKQFPLQAKVKKPAEGTEMNIEQSGQTGNIGAMETEERDGDQQQQQAQLQMQMQAPSQNQNQMQTEVAEKTETTADQTEQTEKVEQTSTTEQSISKAQGQESDPICLE